MYFFNICGVCMGFLSNVSMRNKFLMPVGISILLFLSIVIYGNISLGEVKNRFASFIDEDVSRINLLGELYSQGLQSEQATRNILINIKDEKAKKNYKKSIKDFDSALVLLNQIKSNTPIFMKSLDTITNFWKELDVHKTEVQNLAVNVGFAEASEYLIKSETPKWRELKDVLLGNITFFKEKVAKEKEIMNSTTERIQIIAIFASIAVFIVVLIISLFFVKKLTKPLEEISRAADKLSQGDFSFTINYRGNDEIGKLGATFDNVKKSLNELSTDMISVNGFITEGRTNRRLELDKLKGEYQKIALSFNQAIDALIVPLKVSAEYLDSFAKGNMPPIIVDEYKGDFEETKDNLNLCISAINKLIEDINLVISNIKLGRINYRADITKHKGDYRKIIEGVNQTLDRLVGLIDEMPLAIQIVDQNYEMLYNNKKSKNLTIV